jgi:tetratricopeptide (TPR) repeat protein
MRMMSYAAERQLSKAREEAKAIYEAAAAVGDTSQMIADLVTMGDLQLASEEVTGAGKSYEQAMAVAGVSGLPAEFKANVELGHHYNLGRVALAKKDPAAAKPHADALMSGATARANQGRIQQAHQLLGLIAMREKDAKAAMAHLSEADQRDAYTLFMLGTATAMGGDKDGAKAIFGRVAALNELPSVPAMLVLSPARKLAQ